MATAVLFIGMNRPHLGREAEAFRYLTGDLTASLDRFQREGFFESREMIGLTPHGGNLNSFFLLFGERAKLDELRRTDAFERVAWQLGAFFSGVTIVPGLNGVGIAKMIERTRDVMEWAPGAPAQR